MSDPSHDDEIRGAVREHHCKIENDGAASGYRPAGGVADASESHVASVIIEALRPRCAA